MTKTFLKELRAAALWCSNEDYRMKLRSVADALSWSITGFSMTPTREALVLLNGAWAHAENILSNVPAEADPNPPLAGVPEAARLAA